MTVMSFRLTDQEEKFILKWARQEKTDKSNAARELLEYGWKFVLLECFRSGKLSLELLVKELGLPISETMDFVTSHGVVSPLDYDDYLQSLENLKKEF